MSSYECFSLEIKDHIAHLEMSRPDALNAMNRIFWKELPEIIRDIDKNSKARVIVLSGQGKHFSAGMDLANFMSGEGSGTKKDPARMRETFLSRGSRITRYLFCFRRLQKNAYNCSNTGSLCWRSHRYGGCM